LTPASGESGTLPPWKTASASLHKRILVRAPAIDRRHRNVEEAQVDAELATVVIPVVEHEVTDNLPPWNGEHLPVASGQTPGSGRGLVVEAAEESPRIGQRGLQAGRRASAFGGSAGLKFAVEASNPSRLGGRCS
jgi:hypothetical protein